MDAVEYELAVAVLLLKQSIDNFEKVCRQEVPLELAPKRHRDWVDPIMRKHSKEVRVYNLRDA